MTTSSNEKKLTQKELNSIFWRTFTTSHAWHFERQQHMAFAFAMIPTIKKLYDTLTGIQMGRIEGPEGWIHEIK